jgi:hypothetical protein
MKSMLRSVIKANKQIEEARSIIAKVQAKCSHPDATLDKVYKADTGNWCEQDNSYWAELTCNRCGKFWYADSVKNPEDYRRGTVKV